MKISELLSVIDEIAPFSAAEEWDNCGLLIGDVSREVGKIAAALEASHFVLDCAIEGGVRTLVVHHPIIFPSISKIDTSSLVGSVIEKAIKNEIAIIAVHTNWDRFGLNAVLAELLTLEKIEHLKNGFGVAGNLSKPMNEKDFVELLKKSWGLSHVIFSRGHTRSFERIALCGGAGGEFWSDATGADVFVTAEMKLHQRESAVFSGLCVAEVDHYQMESASMQKFAALIGAKFIEERRAISVSS